MLKAFTWSGQGRKQKSSRFSIIKRDNLGGRGLISTLFNGSRHNKWLPPIIVQREAFLCREFHIKVTETKVPNKKKEKKKNNLYKAFCCIQLFFFFFLNKWCQQKFLHSHQLLVLKSYSSKVFVQVNPIAMPRGFCDCPLLPTFSCRTH